MFKFLHTADLHLGKVFHDQSLGEDQAAMLEDLVTILKDESYSALVIAGDVYDRSIPPPEAVELFGAFLGKIKRLSHAPEVIVIPGNHDSTSRLGFGRELFSRLGIHFGVRAVDCAKPVIVEKESGESCAFFLLPFLSPGTLDAEDPAAGPLRSQFDLAEEAAKRMEKVRLELADRGVKTSVLVAHLFASGGVESDSERVFIGNAEQVNIGLFKGFDYIALGHLHRCQKAGNSAADTAWYSGSPLAYSFGEAGRGRESRAETEKYFLSVELGECGAKIEKIPVKPLHKLTSLAGPFARFSGDVSRDAELLAAADNYLELRLTDRGITENARDILRKRFPRLLSLRQDEALAGLSAALSSTVYANAAGIRGEQRGISADFKDFLAMLYGEVNAAETSPPLPLETEAEIELFNLLLAEAEAEETS